ncbi:winged helix-turn-helix domain-containing protein [Metabacillus sp. KIGAM252]|uniref:Winged helix-turn-helix domain-containing protein n=1 Tax=Metabacillus flavus TaxID=2823519 RepID=A0ABS5L9I9_9BACI|nr:FHA domain-containing protein [Metabacillus flavus]MBS2967385.1 winged helix-turn-helix domain-containing protein [Metabacillus flavus]
MLRACLRVEEGHGFAQGAFIPFKRNRMLIGRSSEGNHLDVHFSNPYISRKHAVIQCENGTYTITNLKSKHGVEVNGLSLEPLQQIPLGDQDFISLAKGAVKLTFINQYEDEIETTKDLICPERQVFKICKEKRLVLIQGQPLRLNGKYMELLLFLEEHCNKVVSYDEIKKRIWPERFSDNSGMLHEVGQEELSALVYRLRKKLGKSGKKIVTAPGAGYMLEK